MVQIYTEAIVHAPPEQVWEVLTDLETYPEWNPHLRALDGTLAVGETLALTVHQGGRDRHIDVTVTELDENRRLEWVERVGFGWLFEGTHTFELEALPDDRTRLLNSERTRGVLVPFAVSRHADQDYEAMNEALARRVESGVADPATRSTPRSS